MKLISYSDLIFERMQRTRVLVIGDMMLDHYLWGDVHRISPEAPVPVVHASHDSYHAGGAANVALNLVNLGVNVSILGYFGEDDAGMRLAGILRDNGVEIINTLNHTGAPTIIKTRVIVRNQQLCRIDREEQRDRYRLDNTAGFEELLEECLDKIDAVLISDYAKGVITQSLLNNLLNSALRRPDLLVSIDPKPSRQLSFKGVGLLTPNRNEALELAGMSPLYPGEEYPLETVCKRIYEKFSPEQLVITLGAEGMAICQDGMIARRLATEAREVFDVSGAGDTVIATLTAALASGMEIMEAAMLANGAAGCVVAHVGTVPVNKDELVRWLGDHTLTAKS